MKISRNPDGSKATELSVDGNHNTLMQLHGDTAIKAVHGSSGQISDVANITQTGEFNFVARPSVNGVDVALATDGESSLDTVQRTIVDNLTTVITLCPVQETVNVLYSVQGEVVYENGELTVRKSPAGFKVEATRAADTGYFSKLEFSASESNGSLLLNVIGSGEGQITNFKYRVNKVNTLYL